MKNDPRRPETLANVLKDFLKESGLGDRVEQSEVIPEWPTLVGERIAKVTKPLFITPDATLFVAVTTHAWMNELQLMAPEILKAVNVRLGRLPVKKIRFQLLRDPSKEDSRMKKR